VVHVCRSPAIAADRTEAARHTTLVVCPSRQAHKLKTPARTSSSQLSLYMFVLSLSW
jgi:hypothetical protein